VKNSINLYDTTRSNSEQENILKKYILFVITWTIEVLSKLKISLLVQEMPLICYNTINLLSSYVSH